MTKHNDPDSIQASVSAVRRAAGDQSPIQGLTHCFYRYPARFSPRFAGAAIDAFSRPDQLVLDPYMGGGTTIVEAVARGRRVIGNDLNSLAVFCYARKDYSSSQSRPLCYNPLGRRYCPQAELPNDPRRT